jgi:nitrite reductase/ring-hydroxylating ferredoxin subunit
VRSGARIDDPAAPRLPVYPVRVDGEAILIAMGVEDVPPGEGS